MIASGTEITSANRAEWLALHHDPMVLSASRFAAALGMSPYGDDTPLALYCRLIGESPPIEETSKMRRGNYLEPYILGEYSRLTNDPIEQKQVFMRGVRLEGVELIATIDAVTAAPNIVEAKSHGWRVREQYGDPGTSDVPMHIYVQVLGQFALSPYTTGCVAASFDDEEEPLIFPITADEQHISGLMERLDRFCWHLSHRVPPEPTKPEDIRHLMGLFSTPKPAIELPPEALALIERFDALGAEQEPLNKALAPIEEERKLIKTKIANLLGGAERGTVNGRVVTAKMTTVKPNEGYKYLDVRIKKAGAK